MHQIGDKGDRFVELIGPVPDAPVQLGEARRLRLDSLAPCIGLPGTKRSFSLAEGRLNFPLALTQLLDRRERRRPLGLRRLSSFAAAHTRERHPAQALDRSNPSKLDFGEFVGEAPQLWIAIRVGRGPAERPIDRRRGRRHETPFCRRRLAQGLFIRSTSPSRFRAVAVRRAAASYSGPCGPSRQVANSFRFHENIRKVAVDRVLGRPEQRIGFDRYLGRGCAMLHQVERHPAQPVLELQHDLELRDPPRVRVPRNDPFEPLPQPHRTDEPHMRQIDLQLPRRQRLGLR